MGDPSLPPPPQIKGCGFCGKPLSWGLLTCWVKAACGEDGDLLGAPSVLSGFESQGRSFESGSRGVCARPKPSSASAMVCPGPCDRAGSCAANRKWRGEGEGEKVRSAVQVTRGQLGPHCPATSTPAPSGRRLQKVPWLFLLLLLYDHAQPLEKGPRLTRRRQARICPAQTPLGRPAARQIGLDFWKSQ